MANRGGFDYYTSVFSPQGSLYQVEYAFNAVKYPGLLSVAIRGKDSVLVVTQHQVPDRLMRPESITALYPVTETVGCCMTGRAPDGKAVVQRAREEATEYKFKYGLPIPIQTLAKRMGDKAQVRTQQAGIRPMGVVATYIGFDECDETGALVPQIWTVDPAGFVCGHFAAAVGKKYVEANAYLEKRQKTTPFDGLAEKDIAMIALSALQNALGASVKASDVEVGRCSATRRMFERVPSSEVEDWLTAVAEAD